MPTLPEPTFGPMVQTCAAFGIGRTKAFELDSKGLIETFQIGTKRYVLIDSLRSLPLRLSGTGEKAAGVKVTCARTAL